MLIMDIFSLRQLGGQEKTRRDIVNYIWRTPEATRGGIIRDLKLCKATVINTIDDLHKNGVVAEGKQINGNKGRAPSSLKISGGQGYSLGISLANNLAAEISIVDTDQSLIAQEKVMDLPDEGRKRLARISSAAKKLITEKKLNKKRLIGIGLTMGGMLDHKRGIVRKSSRFPSSDDFSVTEFFENDFNTTCILMEKSAALAFTEKEWGAAKDMATFLYFDGCGLGMFLDGRIFMGHQNYGGEIGFIKISDSNLLEADGRTGTYNRITPFRQMGTRILEAIELGANTLVSELLKNGQNMSIPLIMEAASKGDKLCRSLIREGFTVASDMIVNLIYLLNPEAVFLWPCTAKCPDISLDIVRERVKNCNIVNSDIQVKILPAKYGNKYLSRGVAMLPLNDFFEKDNFGIRSKSHFCDHQPITGESR